MDTEDLTIHMKIIITSIATHYRPFFFFSGVLRTDEKKKVVCVYHVDKIFKIFTRKSYKYGYVAFSSRT